MSNSAKEFRNIGPVSLGWLNAVGIHTLEDLRRVGSVNAYKKICAKGIPPNLNLLYALEGAILDIPWQALSQPQKTNLKCQS